MSLGTENIDRLWQLFVHQPNFNADQNLFLKWINKPREIMGTYEKREYFLFNDEERNTSSRRSCATRPTSISKRSLSAKSQCFHKFFKIINRQEGHID